MGVFVCVAGKMCCRKNKLEGELEFGKKLENIAFITALVIVIALFSLPIIFLLHFSK